MKKSRKALLTSALSLLLCFSMLLGTTFAWFTDSVTSSNNIIKSGNLDVELEYWNGSDWKAVKSDTALFEEDTLWEPGYTQVVYLRVANKGSLALKYQLGINIVNETEGTNVDDETFKLSDHIYMGVKEGKQPEYATREAAVEDVKDASGIISTGYSKDGDLAAGAKEQYLAVVVYMPTTVENEANYKTGTNPPKITLGIKLLATQKDAELDSFGSDYDVDAEWPDVPDVNVSVAIKVENGAVKETVTVGAGSVKATIPAGVAVNAGTEQLTLTVSEKESSDSNVTAEGEEKLVALDVHIEGVSENNTTPITVELGEALPVGLNMGNYKLYHVENGNTVEMALVDSAADFTDHNQFKYDPKTGNVTLYMATFSEVALLADTENAWNGEYDYEWYDADATELTIANADQLAGFSAIVGGMAKDEDGNFLITYTDSDGDEHHNDTFSGKTVKLISDVNLGDDEENNDSNIIFYPIGYWNSEGTYEKSEIAISSGFYTFQGTFDGNGNTIANFYQNTWEMKGDHDWYDAKLQYYRDGMGLFGRVYGGTVKNLTVDNFSCDSEIGTTGVIAAYADSKDGNPAIFENISITNCNPRVYNIGNGGIVGCAGWYSRNNSLGNDDYTNAVTFCNITVDQTNKISALWGSWGVSCAGILGQYYPNSSCGIKLENCHVAAIIDVNNDVCSNYQYYWYRYAGMFIGTIRANTKDANGYTVADTTGVTATGCTYTMGNWNEYWYCEIVANSLASYTHDHQFSRLTNIYDLSEIKSGGTWLKEGHFALLDENRDIVECYHIFKNSEGNLYRHFHDVADESNPNIYETFDLNGDGELNDLKEDRQRYYIPFNQLLTGLDMGIKAHTAFDGITFVENGTMKSVAKFNVTTNTEIPKDGVVNIGDLFTASGNGEISSPTVQVYVSPVGEGSTVSATYSANVDDWNKGTLTFSGTGSAKVVITDYFYCANTVLNVTVGGVETAFEKFATKFDKDFLYRVGNASGSIVALGTMFKAVDGVTIDDSTVKVSFETIAGNAAGKYTANTSTWTDGTVQFSGTGVIKVTITALGAKDFDLYLEVVDAVNATSAIAGSGKNYVLLNDVTFGSTYLYYKNSTLYGNGFTIDITGADHSDLKDASDTSSNKSAYCNIWMVDSRFDNVRIVGSVYPEVGMTADSDYGNAAIRTEGDCYITNSYISNTRVPLRVQGNTTLIDTVVDGGRYANIELRSGKLTLDGVTTINTVRKGSDDTTDVIGFGIVIHSEAANASIAVIGDGLKQYNWVGETEHKGILSQDTNLESAYKLIFNANNSDTIYFAYNNDRYVNTGILCLCADFNKDVVTGVDDRYYQEVSGYDAWVLTYDNSKHTDWFNESVTTETVAVNPEQYPVVPKYTGSEAQTVEFTRGETYYFDTSVLAAEKFGQKLDVSSVVMNGTTYSYGDKIPMTEGGIYEIIYTVVDPYNYNADASSTTTVTHAVSVTVTAVAKDAEILAPKFTFIDQNGNKYESTTVKVGDKTYVMPNVTAADPTTNSMSSINIGSASISGTTVYFPVATGYTVRSGSNFNRYYPLFNGINITDYTVAGDTTGTTYTTSGDYTSLVGSSGTKFIIPANGGQTNCGDYVKTDGQAGNAAGNSDSGWQGAGYNTSYGGTYLKSGNTNASSDADSNGYERIVWVEYCFNAGNGDVYYYRIGYHCNKEAAQSCVTGDTLVTLADGTQKRVDALTGDEMLLVWNHTTGAFDAAPVAYIVDHECRVSEEIITQLYFDNGYEIKMIGEHVFFDNTLNKYVALTTENAETYISHSFAVKSGDALTTAKLVKVDQYVEETAVYEVVSYEHITCFTNNILSASAYLDQLLNVFDINPETMAYNAEAVQKDIETYGLYTYADFEGLIEEEAFELYNAKYLKIAVGKGYITWDDILALIDIYFGVNVEPIQ